MTFNSLIELLQQQFSARESENTAVLLWEDGLKIKKTQVAENQTQIDFLNQSIERLFAAEPIQYILREAHFYGHRFYVDSAVLIPRPETEELCYWVLEDVKKKKKSFSLLDIGTGSGCIPITISLEVAKYNPTVYACDISEDALVVAQKNAAAMKVKINFQKLDFLNAEESDFAVKFDVIVSNPPYIPPSEKVLMANNVLKYEPSIALFSPQDNPCIFYKKIADSGRKMLTDQGVIYVEMNEFFAHEIDKIFADAGYKTEIAKDMEGKARMLKAEIKRLSNNPK